MYEKLEEREELKNKIKKLRNIEKNEIYTAMTQKSTAKLQKCKKMLGKLQSDEAGADKMLQDLKIKVEEYKNKKGEEIKEKIRSTVVKYITEINSFQDITIGEYRKIEKIKRKMHKFANFRNQLQRTGRQIKDEILKNLEKHVEDLMFDEDRPVEMLMKMEEMFLTEQFFNECIFVNMIYARIYDNFSFHFFTQKETNRLDMPEWYFKFILDQLKKYKFVCECYDKVAHENKGSKINEEMIAVPIEGFSEGKERKKSMNGLIERLYSIIEIKINELRKCESNQKRNLLFHFTEEYLSFKNELRRKYEVNFNMLELADCILRVQKDYIVNSLHKIHCAESNAWFSSYKKIYKENFLLALSYVSLQNDIFNDLINFISNVIVEYLEVFIDKMCFINKEEKEMICFLIVGVESLKNFLRLEESMFILKAEEKTEVSVEILKNINIDTHIFMNFNESNIKLLKTLVYHDISRVLVNFLYFHSTTKTSLRQNCSEISKIILFYTKQLGHMKVVVESFLFDKIDNFIVDKIVLENKFDSELLFIYKALVQRITQMYGTKTDWRCLVAYKHLKDIFNGATEGDDFFEKVYGVYK